MSTDLKPNLAKAVIKVIQAVKGIDKNLTVGTGNASYKGVSDQEVKKIIGNEMAKNGLCLLPIGVNPTVHIERWEEEVFDNYQKKTVIKQKQQVFTEASTQYLLLHESGESQVLEGYGQGVDSQDKSAGKATTYALKYVMLYTFLVPTGKIDDADNTHSDEIAPPQIQQPQPIVKKTLSDKAFGQAVERIIAGEKELAQTIKDTYILSSQQAVELNELL